MSFDVFDAAVQGWLSDTAPTKRRAFAWGAIMVVTLCVAVALDRWYTRALVGADPTEARIVAIERRLDALERGR